MSDFRSDLCKKCIHTKVCMKDKNVCGDVFVPGNPLLFDNKKLWKKYEERKAKGFPCDDFVDANIVPKWIPVKERLPEIDEKHHCSKDVLAYLEDGGMCFTALEENIFGQVWFECERHLALEEEMIVTHWMPLPEPPKEEPKIISAVDCKDCRYYPPSSLNGKPCTQCDMGNPLMNCFSPKEDEA